MLNESLKKYSNEDCCPIRNVLDRFGDKWSVLVLMVLSEGEVLRFKELRTIIPDISQKMLTVTLRTLEADGLISRRIFPEIPPRVEYRLTDLGHSLVPYIVDLTRWARNHFQAIITARQAFEKN